MGEGVVGIGIGAAIITGAAWGLNKVGLAPHPRELFSTLSASFKNGSLISGGSGGQTYAGINTSKEAFTSTEIYMMADEMIRQYGFHRVNPLMLTTVSKIESSFKRKAYRYESHIDDASYGLTQVLYGTAKWLQSEMGYNKRPIISGEGMYNAVTGLYFGASYLDWLIKSYGGTEEQIIRRYNGGPNGDKFASTQHHWNKYFSAKNQLVASLKSDGVYYG